MSDDNPFDSAPSWADYDREPLEIFEQQSYVVYDPWQAREVGTFTARKDAEFFIRKFVKRWRKYK